MMLLRICFAACTTLANAASVFFQPRVFKTQSGFTHMLADGITVLVFAATSPSHRPMGCAASGCRDAARRRRSQAVSRSVNLGVHSARQDEGKTIQLLAEIFHYVIAFQHKLHFSTMRGKPSIWRGNAHDVIEISCA